MATMVPCTRSPPSSPTSLGGPRPSCAGWAFCARRGQAAGRRSRPRLPQVEPTGRRSRRVTGRIVQPSASTRAHRFSSCSIRLGPWWARLSYSSATCHCGHATSSRASSVPFVSWTLCWRTGTGNCHSSRRRRSRASAALSGRIASVHTARASNNARAPGRRTPRGARSMRCDDLIGPHELAVESGVDGALELLRRPDARQVDERPAETGRRDRADPGDVQRVEVAAVHPGDAGAGAGRHRHRDVGQDAGPAHAPEGARGHERRHRARVPGAGMRRARPGARCAGTRAPRRRPGSPGSSGPARSACRSGAARTRCDVLEIR